VSVAAPPDGDRAIKEIRAARRQLERLTVGLPRSTPVLAFSAEAQRAYARLAGAIRMGREAGLMIERLAEESGRSTPVVRRLISGASPLSGAASRRLRAERATSRKRLLEDARKAGEAYHRARGDVPDYVAVQSLPPKAKLAYAKLRRAIKAARSPGAKIPYRELAEAVGLSRHRVYQIAAEE
jgi:hypothetical protein